MEAITGLVLLLLLVIPPMMMAGSEILSLLLENNNDMSDKIIPPEQEPTPVYDGMSTVEIPVMGPQVVAYEPVLPPGEEFEIELVMRPERVSRA